MVWKPIGLTDFKMLKLKIRNKYLFAKMYFLGVILKKIQNNMIMSFLENFEFQNF